MDLQKNLETLEEENQLLETEIREQEDKLSKLQGQRQIHTIQAELKKDWGMLPPEFMTSAFKKTGQDSLWDWMETHIPISQSVSLNSP